MDLTVTSRVAFRRHDSSVDLLSARPIVVFVSGNSQYSAVLAVPLNCSDKGIYNQRMTRSRAYLVKLTFKNNSTNLIEPAANTAKILLFTSK
jgi:hypothetical protein